VLVGIFVFAFAPADLDAQGTAVILSGVYALYAVLALHLFGRTVGMSVLRLRVVDAAGGPLRLRQVAVRWVGSIVSALPAGLGYFWLIFDREQRTWHDRWSGTWVIRTPRAESPEVASLIQSTDHALSDPGADASGRRGEVERHIGKAVALASLAVISLALATPLVGYGIVRLSCGCKSWRAVARLHAAGVRTEWKQVIPSPLADSQNAAPFYDAALALLDIPDNSRKAVRAYLAASTREGRRPHELTTLLLLARNGRALAFARRAAKRPGCRFDYDWSTPYEPEVMSESSGLRDLARLASAQAVFRADWGDLPGALEAWSLNLAIARHMESQATILGQATGYSALGSASNSLREVLQDARPSGEQCRTLVRALARVDLDKTAMRMLSAECAMNLWQVRRWQNLRVLARAAARAPNRRRGLDVLCYWFFSRADDAAMLQFWERELSLAREPYRETAEQQASLRENAYPPAFETARVTSFFTTATRDRDWAKANVSLMRTALGLSAYRSLRGTYPESLAQLRGALQWQTPTDPFSGKSLVYRKQGSGYLLYSIGPDLRDDRGRPLRRQPVDDSFEGDIVWRVER
jgi:uncharacterized RDD family membrane protein YckC